MTLEIAKWTETKAKIRNTVISNFQTTNFQWNLQKIRKKILCTFTNRPYSVLSALDMN